MVSLGAGAINAAWSCNTAVMVLFCRQVLHIDTIGYGLLLACEAIGGIMAGRYPGRFLNGRPARSTLALIMYLQAITWLTIGLIHSVWVIAICLPVMGFTSTIASVVISGPRQTIPPEHMLGQMLSISRTVGVGAAALGALAGGIISRGLGLTATFYISALILVVAAFIVRFEPNRFCRETAAAPAVEAVDKRPALASVGER